MKNVILVFSLLLSAVSSFGQQVDLDCVAAMHVGKFVVKGEDSVQITRTEKKQIEVYNGGEGKAILRIDWTSPTTYTLTYLRGRGIRPNSKRGDTIAVEVLGCNDTEYTFRAYLTAIGDKSAMKGTMLKLE